MKKNFFPVALMALAIGFNACSSDDVTVNANGGGFSSALEGGYAKVSINLPSSSNSSRANDIFDDGLASEYHVNNAKLVLFQGSNEGDATFHSAYELKVGMDGYKDDPNQITTTTRIISRLNDASLGTAPTGPNLYALVVLNDNGLLEISENGQKLTFKGKTAAEDKDFSGMKLSDLQKLAVSSKRSDFKSNGLLMTNAPLAKQPGGTNTPAGEVVTLVDFTNSVYNTEAEAQKNPATDVYVERAVAKVTMNEGSGENLEFNIKTAGGTPSTSNSDVHFIGKEDKKIHWKIVGWDLDVTNNSSYLVRNTTNTHAATGDAPWNGLKSENAATSYRFVGSNAVKTNSNLYRTYWAEDPNYSSFNSDDFTYLPSNKTDFTKEFGLNNPKYCFENTFDVDHQVKQGTTRVMVKVQLTDENNTAETFYTFNGDNSRLYKQADFENRIKAAILREPNVEAWVKKNGGSTEDPNIVTKLDYATKTVTVNGHDVTVVDRNAADGQIHLTDFTVQVGSNKFNKASLLEKLGKTTISDEDLAKALNLGKLVSYENGCAYYPIRIKHFGKDDTPWNTEDNAPTTKPSKGATTAQIYPGTDPTRSNNYLGRYGVLRNNWYDISVSKISAIGSPVVPGVDETPDDDFYNYIAVRINVLSWAKRTQVEEL